VCTQASRAISLIVKSYSNLYTLRRTPSFVPYFVLASTIFHLGVIRDDGANALSKEQLLHNVRDLKDMSACHGAAVQALDIVHLLASTWKVGIFDGTHEGNILQGVSHLPMNVDHLYLLGWGVTMMDQTPRSSTFEDLALPPLPLHGRVSVATGAQELEDAGFAILPERNVA